ncbi:MAG: Lon protease family protein [Xanthomonadaceae bacterium]|nr:Lon protease family protein [Xanthomonadaceae bacterium]
MNPHHVLTPRQLCRECDPDSLGFTTTDELQVPRGLNLQTRAAEALCFGLGIQRRGYNLYVMGEPGSGRHELVLQELRSRVRNEPAGDDLCVVRNFQDPYAPRWLSLPAGNGAPFVASMQAWLADLANALKSFERELVAQAIGSMLAGLRERWAGIATLVDYLDALAGDLLQQLERLHGELQDMDQLESWLDDPGSLAGRYQVHLLVSREGAEGAPLEYWNGKGRSSLFGAIEPRIQPGSGQEDLRLLRAGALQRANGGYLVLDAENLLTDMELWRDFKQLLATGRLEPERSHSGTEGVAFAPMALPVRLQVVMIGERDLYYQLAEQDADFLRLFKVQVDFDDRLEWNATNQSAYVTMLASLIEREELLPMRVEAVARMVEEGARLVEDAERITTNLGVLADILRETDYWARQAGSDCMRREHVERSIQEWERRASRVRERFHEDILRNNVMIHTEGRLVAQVNGLMVVEAGDYVFGLPSRITATAWLGEGEIIDIEREAQLGGALHSKGVMILSQFVGARYARTRSLSVTASLVFEQSYGPLDGDSASLGELCALLSALADLPMAQYLGVTGSVNQFGEVQSVGAVNEKIEGFFDICVARGLTGEQGVILPASNMVNLMLRQDLVQAVQAGRFHLYAVDHVDQAMALLIGLEAGQCDEHGEFPLDTINGRVASRLLEFARLRQEQENPSRDDERDKHAEHD